MCTSYPLFSLSEFKKISKSATRLVIMDVSHSGPSADDPILTPEKGDPIRNIPLSLLLRLQVRSIDFDSSNGAKTSQPFSSVCR